jgi:hypothetical protein
LDIRQGELAESHLDALIARRHDQRVLTDGERAREALWAQSVRTHEEKSGRRLLWEWWRYHSGQAARHRRTLSSLIDHHEAEARRYASLLGIDEPAKRNGYKKGEA